MQTYGPARTAPQYTSMPHAMPKAQEHVKYLSSACSSISEAIRTGPARGVKSDVMRGLYEEYRQKCSLEEQEARTQVHQDARAQQQVHVAQRERGAADKREANIRADRCLGMRDVISLKRKREAELNAKEIDALRALERTFNEVCT